MRRRWRELLAGGLLAAVFVAVLAFFAWVHVTTGDWWPKAIPTSVQYDGRDFSCSPDAHIGEGSEALRGLTERGHTIGGGTIYAPPGSDLPTGIAVADGNTVRSCSLNGAP